MLNLSKYTVLSRYGERPYGCVAITWITNSSCVPLLPSPLPRSLCAPPFQLQWRSFGQSRCWLRQVPTDTCAATAKSRARCSAGAGQGAVQWQGQKHCTGAQQPVCLRACLFPAAVVEEAPGLET